MRIQRIEYMNYRGLGDGHIDFEPDMTVIVGENGAGKTSVLKSVSIAISWIVSRLRADKGVGTYIDEESITNGSHHAQITALFDEIDSITIPNKAKPGITKRFALQIDALRAYAAERRSAFEQTNFKVTAPVFAFYGVKRAVIDIPLRTKDNEFSLMSAYEDCLNGRANFRNFFIWFRNQEDYENEVRSRIAEGETFSSRELDAFRKALSICMPDYRNIHVRRHPLRMVIEKNGQALQVSQLSDGEKIYLALIGDLCQRLVLANPVLEDPLQGNGIVLIDEIDLHLHPAWQSLISAKLRETFPNIQFIISTHSPHVINSVPDRSLRKMEHATVVPTDPSYGLPSLIVLKDIMGLRNDEPLEVEQLKREVYEALSKGDLFSGRPLLEQLEQRVPCHPELSRLRKIIERLERRG